MAPKSTGGFIVKAPDQKGEWSVRAFAFHPNQMVVRQGDIVVLNFMGVQGRSHNIFIDGQPEPLALCRGEMKSVRFVANQPGTVRFVSVGREPTMHAPCSSCQAKDHSLGRHSYAEAREILSRRLRG